MWRETFKSKNCFCGKEFHFKNCHTVVVVYNRLCIYMFNFLATSQILSRADMICAFYVVFVILNPILKFCWRQHMCVSVCIHMWQSWVKGVASRMRGARQRYHGDQFQRGRHSLIIRNTPCINTTHTINEWLTFFAVVYFIYDKTNHIQTDLVLIKNCFPKNWNHYFLFLYRVHSFSLYP